MADTAKAMASRIVTTERIVREWVDQFRVHLLSEKFQGYERTCGACGQLCDYADDGKCSLCCHAYVVAERKDWISVGDVQRWLDDLQGRL